MTDDFSDVGLTEALRRLRRIQQWLDNVYPDDPHPWSREDVADLLADLSVILDGDF